MRRAAAAAGALVSGSRSAEPLRPYDQSVDAAMLAITIVAALAAIAAAVFAYPSWKASRVKPEAAKAA